MYRAVSNDGKFTKTPSSHGTVLIDSTSLALSWRLIRAGPPTAHAILALGNLVDAIVLNEGIATLPPWGGLPDDDDFVSMRKVCTELGVRVKALTLTLDEAETILHQSQREDAFEFGLIPGKEPDNHFLERSSRDRFAEQLLAGPGGIRDRETGKVVPQWELRPPPELRRMAIQEEGLFRSNYGTLYSGTTIHEGYHRRRVRLGPWVSDAAAFIAYRAAIYQYVSSKYGIPYRPDALRTHLVWKQNQLRNQITIDVVGKMLRDLESLDRAFVARVNHEWGTQAVGLRIPILLSHVFKESKSCAHIIATAMDLSKASSARKLRRALRGIEGELMRPGGDPGRATTKMAEIRAISEEFSEELGKTGQSDRGDSGLTSYIVDQGLDVGTDFLLHSLVPAQTIKNAIKAAGTRSGRTAVRHWLTKRQLLFLRDPLAEGRGCIEMNAQVRRLFGNGLSGDELDSLVRLKRLTSEAAAGQTSFQGPGEERRSSAGAMPG